MVDKKHWLNKIHEEPKSSQEYISWSSSEGEADELSISDICDEVDDKMSLRWVKPIEDDDLFSCSSSDQSPIISSVCAEESSPVIGRKRKMKEMRSKFKKAKEMEECSPESQSTQIIDSESPEIIIDIDSNSVNSLITKQDSSFSSHSSNNLYYQPSTRRKRFKKKGLASLLKKTLDLQKTRVSIWKHELYMKRVSDIVQDVIKFKVINIRNEYGNVVLECDEIFEDRTDDSEEHLNLILILVNQSENMDFKEDLVYKLHPPYLSKIVTYKSRDVTCHFNVTRIVK